MRSEIVKKTFITLEPKGYLSAANVQEFQSQLIEAVNRQDQEALLVDLKGVEFLDSAGLMALVSTYRLTQNQGRRFSLCSVTPAVKMILELTQLDRVFEIFENQEAFQVAIAA